MRLLKLDSLLSNAIHLKNIEYTIRFVDCYLRNRNDIVTFNMIDIRLYELWRNKKEWLSATDDNSDIKKRLEEMFDKLDVYFW